MTIPTKEEMQKMATKKLLVILRQIRMVNCGFVGSEWELEKDEKEYRRKVSECFENLTSILATRPHIPRKEGNFAEVTFIPMGNKIKYRIRGRVHCHRMKKDIANSGMLRDAKQCADLFGTKSDLARFMKANRPIKKVMDISALGYDFCDVAT